MRRSQQKELMDLPGQPRDLLEGNFDDIRAINRYLGGHRSVIHGLARLAREQTLAGFSLLDVGTGGGDIPARISHWAEQRGIAANIVALEPEPLTARLAVTIAQRTNAPSISRTREKTRDPSLAFALSDTVLQRLERKLSSRTDTRGLRFLPAVEMTDRPMAAVLSLLRYCLSRRREERRPLLQRPPSIVVPAKAGIQWENEGNSPRHAISVVRGDGGAPPFGPASFDFVLASQLLHHFPENKIVSLLKTWSKVARKAIIISDLVRHPVAYYGIRMITKLCTRNMMTRTDAPLSVQRAFTIAEWRELFRRADVGPFRLFPVFPFRVLALLALSG